MKRKYQIYIALFMIICLLPSAGLLFAGVGESSENREMAQFPALFTEDGIDTEFLREAGDWYEDHFAFREKWVTGYALLLGKGFGVSAQERVIVGRDGWLFYKDSLEDYQGTAAMTERQLFDVAHTMAMIQEYADQKGIAFAFTVAPNKNSLYGAYMPYYYQPFRKNKGNLERLKEYLQAEGVHYIDLSLALRSQEKILYHKRDSHWNNEGAALAADQILTGIEKQHPSYADRSYKVRKDFTGDLDQMLYPAKTSPEEEIYYDPLPQFTYCEDVENNFAPKIHTHAAGSGNLVMYRDSFGNALLPFMAEAFENAYFSRAIPYYLQDLTEQKADTLVIERAERFLPDMAQEAPEMEAPVVQAETVGKEQKAEELNITRQGDYIKVTGKLTADAIQTDARIFVKVNKDLCYEAFPVSDADGREGFSLLLDADSLHEKGNQFEVFCSE